MHPLQVMIWFGILVLHYSVDALPAALSFAGSSQHGGGADVMATSYHTYSPRGEVRFDHYLSDISKRAPAGPKKLGNKLTGGKGKLEANPPTTNPPQTPQGQGSNQQTTPPSPPKDKGKGKAQDADSPKQDKGKGPAVNPKTPAQQEGNDKKNTVYNLGECGSEEPGVSVKNVDKSGQTPVRKPKALKPPKTPKPPKGYEDGDDNENLGQAEFDAPSGTKKMYMCPNKVALPFPNYPSSGDVLGQGNWKKIIEAYNVVKPNPCDNDYDFKKVPLPKKNTEGVHTPAKSKEHIRDMWQTEHVMDGQILKRFFQEMFEGVSKPTAKAPEIRTSDIPTKWRSSVKGTTGKQNQCDYLDQFWTKRWGGVGNPDPTGNAMKYLLSEFPGGAKYGNEMLLLPGRLNIKKSHLFGLKGYNVISPTKFKKMPLHQKVDELRELVLLIAYLNEPEFRKHFKAVGERIRDRLVEIEAGGPTGYMRKTDDYWYKQTLDKEDNKLLKDADDEKYESVGLAKRWVTFINDFVEDRTVRMQSLLVELHFVLVSEWEDAKTYVDLPAFETKGGKPTKLDFKESFDTRMAALGKHVKKTVDTKKLKIGTTSRSSTPVPSDPEDRGNESSDSGLPETPSKPSKVEPQPILLPDRTKPKPGPSTPKPNQQ